MEDKNLVFARSFTKKFLKLSDKNFSNFMIVIEQWLFKKAIPLLEVKRRKGRTFYYRYCFVAVPFKGERFKKKTLYSYKVHRMPFPQHALLKKKKEEIYFAEELEDLHDFWKEKLKRNEKKLKIIDLEDEGLPVGPYLLKYEKIGYFKTHFVLRPNPNLVLGWKILEIELLNAPSRGSDNIVFSYGLRMLIIAIIRWKIFTITRRADWRGIFDEHLTYAEGRMKEIFSLDERDFNMYGKKLFLDPVKIIKFRTKAKKFQIGGVAFKNLNKAGNFLEKEKELYNYEWWRVLSVLKRQEKM